MWLTINEPSEQIRTFINEQIRRCPYSSIPFLREGSRIFATALLHETQHSLAHRGRQF